MIRKDYLKIVNKIISFSILANIFLLPVFFDYFFLLKNTFILPKTIIFYILLSLTFIFTIIKLFLVEKIKLSKRFLLVCLVPIFLLLSLSMGSLFSLDIGLAWKGSYSRQNGLLFYLSIFLWFFLLSFNYYQDRKTVVFKKVLLVVSFSSLFVSLYAILQYFGLDWFLWTESTRGERVFSSLGQPNYLGLFINLVWPIVFYLLISGKKLYEKIFFSFLLLLNFLALFFSFSRGAWLGALLGVVFLFVYCFLKVSKKKAIIGFLILILISPLFFTQEYFVYRISHFFDYKTGSGADRTLIWHASLDKVEEKPFLGYGLEQQEIVFRSSYNKDWALYENYTVFMDRAHNIFLDYLLIGGLVYLSIYLVWMFFILKSFCLSVKKNKVSPEIFLSLSLFIYLFSLLFTFETIVDLVYFWLFSVFVVMVFVKNKNDEYYVNNFLFKLKDIFKIIISFFLVVLFLIFSFFQVKVLVADYNFSLFEKSFYRKEFSRGVDFYEKAMETNEEKMYYKIFVKNIDFYKKDIEKDPHVDVLVYEAYLGLNDYYDDLIVKAKAANYLGSFKDSEELLVKAINQAPDNYKAYYVLAEVYFDNFKYDLAEEYYNLTIDRLPELSDERVEVSHKQSLGNFLGDIYEKKADIASYNNDEELAIEYLEEAFGNNNNSLLLKEIADKYYNLNMVDKAVEYNMLGETINEDDPAWPAAIAWLYYLNGDFDKAIEKINRVFILDSNYESALELKRLLSK